MVLSAEGFGLNGRLSAKLELWLSFLKDDDFAMWEMAKNMEI